MEDAGERRPTDVTGDEHERRHGRRPEDDGLTRAEHGRQRDDEEVQARQRHGREIVAPKAHPEDDRQGHQQPRRVERRRTSGGSAQGEDHLDREIDRAGPIRPTASWPAMSSITRAAKTTATARMTCGSAAMRFIAWRHAVGGRGMPCRRLWRCRNGGVDHTMGASGPPIWRPRAQRGCQRQRIVAAASSAVSRMSSSSSPSCGSMARRMVALRRSMTTTAWSDRARGSTSSRSSRRAGPSPSRSGSGRSRGRDGRRCGRWPGGWR